jgi:hypothetical protein
MNFLIPEEFLLLMNYNPYMPEKCHVLTLDERKILREAGIQTAIEYSCLYAIEPERGKYDFSSMEEILRLNRGAGMKTIFSVPNPYFPKWMPNEWKSKYSDESYNDSSFSFWNTEGIEHLKGYFKVLMDKFLAPDVMFVLAELDTGESAFPSHGFYDDAAIQNFKAKHGNSEFNYNNPDVKEWLEDSIVSHFLEMQTVFYPQYKEVWNNLQWLIAHWNSASMNYLQPRILKAFKETFLDVNIVLLQYTYFDSSHPDENEVYVDKLKNEFDLDVIVEAMFCKGLPETTPKAVMKGFRGQIICPTHPHTQEPVLADWMVDNIRKSHQFWTDMRMGS